MNQSASIAYQYATGDLITPEDALFAVPQVRGILYDIQFDKTDDAGAPLSGATFTISGANVNGSETYTGETTSDANGKVSFTGLVYGTYSVTETDAPDGYEKGFTSSWTFTIPANAPDSASGLTPVASTISGNESHWLWNKNDVAGGGTASEALTVVNAPSTEDHTVTILKVAGDGMGGATTTRLGGATFQFYSDSGCTAGTEVGEAITTSSVSGSTLGMAAAALSGSTAGTTYYLKEIAAPSGYQLSGTVYTVVVYKDTQAKAGNYITVDGAEPDTANQVTIADQPKVNMPVTRGSGILWIEAAGLAAVGAGTWLLLRRRREQ